MQRKYGQSSRLARVRPMAAGSLVSRLLATVLVMLMTAALCGGGPATATSIPQDAPVAGQDPPPAAGAQHTLLRTALILIGREEWSQAVEKLEELIKVDPNNGSAWYLLGFCQHKLGAYEDAIPAFKKAILLRREPIVAMYNIACGYALLDKPDDAIEWLTKSVEAGFNQPDAIERDLDLESLRDDPRYKEILRKLRGEVDTGAVEATFQAADGVTVYADLYAADKGKQAPMLLLFHMAGSNAAEYDQIAPKLNALGFNCLAVDARSGFRRWNKDNRTKDKLGRIASYMDAYTDLVAALNHVKRLGYTGRISAWGSDYSAGLVFKLAIDNPNDIGAVLSFSPHPPDVPALGEEFKHVDWVTQVKVPVFVMWAEREMNDQMQSLFDSIGSSEKVLFVPEHGVHGSSTLRNDRNPIGSRENWQAVTGFLDEHCR